VALISPSTGRCSFKDHLVSVVPIFTKAGRFIIPKRNNALLSSSSDFNLKAVSVSLKIFSVIIAIELIDKYNY
jgi:hypothetical protein